MGTVVTPWRVVGGGRRAGYSDREWDLQKAAYFNDVPRVSYYSTYVAGMLEAYR